jgi:hypothetical protein
VVLPRKRGRVGPPRTRATAPTTDIEVGLFNCLHQGHMSTRVPSVKMAPDDGFDVVEAVYAFTRWRMTAWKTSGRSELQRRSTTPIQRPVRVSRNRLAQRPFGRS